MKVTFQNEKWIPLPCLVCENICYFQRWLKKQPNARFVEVNGQNARKLRALGACGPNAPVVTMIADACANDLLEAYAKTNPKYPVSFLQEPVCREVSIDENVGFHVCPARVIEGESWIQIVGAMDFEVYGANVLAKVQAENCIFVRVLSFARFQVVSNGTIIHVDCHLFD